MASLPADISDEPGTTQADMGSYQAKKDDLQLLEAALTQVVGAILQKPNRVAGAIVGVATSKLVAAGVIAGTFGAIGAFGAASTGIAIATLSGAAATSATLFWIGSSVGLGVAAGGTLLTGGALLVGVPSAIYMRRTLLGRPRTEEMLSPREQSFLYAALRLAAATQAVRQGGTDALAEEKHLVAKYSLTPLLTGLQSTYLEKSKDTETCASRRKSLAVLPLRRLRSAERSLDQIRQKWLSL